MPQLSRPQGRHNCHQVLINVEFCCEVSEVRSRTSDTRLKIFTTAKATRVEEGMPVE